MVLWDATRWESDGGGLVSSGKGWEVKWVVKPHLGISVHVPRDECA